MLIAVFLEWGVRNRLERPWGETQEAWWRSRVPV